MTVRGGVLIAAFASVVLVAGAAVVLQERFRGASTPISLQPDDPETVTAGYRIYARECAACHGDRLEGQPNWRNRNADGRLPAPPHDASGHTWHHPDGQLFALTKYGPAAMAGNGYQSDMPAYDGVLSDSEIVAVLSYIKSRWPQTIRERHDELNARARQ